MKLYKNVDIFDVENILRIGLKCLDVVCDNWESGNRANNDTSVVYLFRKIKNGCNSFPRYGAALLEIETSGAVKNEIGKNDYNYNKYIEYVKKEIRPEEIKNIYIPYVYREKCAECLDSSIFSRVTFCEFSADIYNGFDLKPATKYDIEKIKRNELNTWEDNFFRGINDKKEVFDYYNINYDIGG